MTDYIRIEAVNIYAAIADCDQISMIRGGGLLLKQAIDDIEEEFLTKITAITTGASIGVFKLNTNTAENSESIKNDISNFLNTSEKYRYFTFVLATCQSEEYQQAKEILLAKCSYLQLKQLSLSPDYQHSDKAASPCSVEGIRKSFNQEENIIYMPDKGYVNEFSKIKHGYGQDRRDKLYRDELAALLQTEKNDSELEKTIKKLQKIEYTTNLEELAAAPEQEGMHAKIAVLYFDGNRFSKIQQRLVHSDEDQHLFDQQIKTLRRLFLVELLSMAVQDSSWFYKQQMRLETLLWGGDEMLFVVPAWKGFELLQLFYKVSKSWAITINDQTENLTHAGGIVFCSHNTPIFKIRQLAVSLADRIKEYDNGREANFFDYLTLESIDYPAESLDDFFNHRYGDLACYRHYLSSQKLVELDFNCFNELLLELEHLIPKSQLYGIAQAACLIGIEKEAGDKDEKDKKLIIKHYQLFEKRLQRLSDISNAPVQLDNLILSLTQLFYPQDVVYQLKEANEDEKINTFLNNNSKLDQQIIKQAIMWLHLVELWDYLMPLSRQMRVEEND